MWNGHQAWFDKKSEKIKSVGGAKKKSMTLNEKRKYLADKWNKNWSLVDKKALRAWQFSSQNTTFKKIVFFRNIFWPQLQCWWLHCLPLVYFVWPFLPLFPFTLPLSLLSHSLSPFRKWQRTIFDVRADQIFWGICTKKKKIGETNPFHQNKINKCTNFVIYKIKLINPHTEHSIAWWKKIADICFSCFKKWQKTVNDVVLSKKLKITKENTKTNDRFFAECAIANKVKKEKIQEK